MKRLPFLVVALSVPLLFCAGPTGQDGADGRPGAPGPAGRDSDQAMYEICGLWIVQPTQDKQLLITDYGTLFYSYVGQDTAFLRVSIDYSNVSHIGYIPLMIGYGTKPTLAVYRAPDSLVIKDTLWLRQ